MKENKFIVELDGTVGKWTVNGFFRNPKNRKLICNVTCECGKKSEVGEYCLKKGLSQGCFECSKETTLTKRRRNMPIVGQKINNWQIIEIFEKDNKTFAKGRCICGDIHEKKIHSFKNSNNCQKCKGLQYKGIKSERCRKGYEELSGTYWTALKVGAKARNHEFTITIEEAWELFIKQDRKCNLSNIPIKLGYYIDGEQTGSVDRIDNSKGYIKGNIQWVHKDVNKMKHAFTQEYFINVCKLISSKCG